MKHLVEHDVLHHKTRHAGMVEDAADDDGVVGGVVVAETVAGMGSAPGELRASHQAVKESAVQVFEDFIEMIVMSGSGVDLLSSAHLADEAGLRSDVMAGDVAAIACALGTVDGLAIELGQQDMRYGMEYGLGRAFEQIGDASVKFSLAHADGVVDGDEGIKPHVHCWNGRTRAQFAVGFLKDFCERGGHVEGRV